MSARQAEDGGDRRASAPARGKSLVELARRQNLLRAVNERIHALGWADSEEEQIGYLCECSLADCAETLLLSPGEYRAVRAAATRFALRRGHEDARVERVVERRRSYVVVENIGEAAEIARRAG